MNLIFDSRTQSFKQYSYFQLLTSHFVFQLILRRLLQAIPTLWVIATATFVLMQLTPGGPFDTEKDIPEEVQALINAHYGLDLPMHEQYLRFLGQRLRGDFGPSYKYAGWDVDEIIAQSFPVSLELGCYALLVALAIGTPIGVFAALRHKRPSETALMGFAMLGICLPAFVLGPILIMVFSMQLGWFNPFGWNTASDRVLPSITLGLFYAAYIARLARSGMLDVMRLDYIRTARAKGLRERAVVLRHALRTALYPVVAYLGPAVAGLISGSFVVETIFFIPGLGSFFVNSAFNRDSTMVMGTVLFYAVLILFFNLLVDLIQMWMNPRTRHD
ncbi:ABC transporter permease [Coraliomargarita sp. SDUM461003]|uniref:ABC transporter permease n=2 Tax=Thalassobacterium TaxID=3410851 RepID=A0ABU1B0A3_9BACT|nr:MULTISPECIES: ABC transporter permease [unclassified Coraliomargarita]MDQ8193165.1 ABC transporter permease [Coraliomargarita sp. SDUM461004]MDQ8208805.1 ABC transporter permease [Coraliomargarita sp. SDUM461003]